METFAVDHLLIFHRVLQSNFLYFVNPQLQTCITKRFTDNKEIRLLWFLEKLKNLDPAGVIMNHLK